LDLGLWTMFFFYSIVYTLGITILLPRFLFDAVTKGKYAAGFKQRLGFLPDFDSKEKKVVWLHCVSVGEANAARPLAAHLKGKFPDLALVVTTTTRTGQQIAQSAFADIADLVFYFPFDWKFSVRRALRRIRPSVVLLMETEIWPNFICEAYHVRAHICIVNGRLSERSFNRYEKLGKFVKRVLGYLDLALMQGNADATRLMSLGIRAGKVRVTGNLKFDHDLNEDEMGLTAELRDRFAVDAGRPMIIAASTHSPEEALVLDAFKEIRKTSDGNLPRLMIAPRHPERFDEVAELVRKTGFSCVRRSTTETTDDRSADIILLDSIGELRAAYPLAEIVFVGGSLIPHGGQSVFEPAAAGKAIITGHYTANFAAAVQEFLDKNAIVQLPRLDNKNLVPKLVDALREFLSNREKRVALGTNAHTVMMHNRGAVTRTLEYLSPLLEKSEVR
jgi:3-deoxy-D-manno-octulosonic-acid transferase